ncbi:hypothetical protein [Sulfoacidibacillus thermotolerans]|uniref:Uncharacterized protein n=1 Tax=Sulfoacidibacillus thermotolerans TaxID=1765684 RepID=A0A2U3D1K5_SULT2|nr:hypothetical protein [Sulfoacidibacillus thermotolerans]PWI55171.1 hypothetical protein BM613_13440 [Sulfoacidibacillus thermotolerans]
MIGVVILSLYGLVTVIGGFAALRSRGAVNISRLQAAVFTLIGMAVIVVAVLSFTKSVGLVWLVLVCVASQLSRVWNGLAMGRVHALHILFFSGILTLGIVLT